MNVAFKIFELALRKFPNEVILVTTYSDFLTALNEPNNVRVLFEKVLTSALQGSGEVLYPESSLVVWNKFLEFESNVGDLASITKVELRRSMAIDRVFGSNGHESGNRGGINGENATYGHTKVPIDFGPFIVPERSSLLLVIRLASKVDGMATTLRLTLELFLELWFQAIFISKKIAHCIKRSEEY